MGNPLTIIQIISITQGLFLGYVLFRKRKEFIPTTFWIFTACIVSVILFSIGDDNYNLFFEDTKWYLFHEPLIITLFFLLTRYINSAQKAFQKSDFLFLIPYGSFVLFETLSNSDHFRGSLFVDLMEDFIELVFIAMLLYCIYDVFKRKKAKWLLLFLVPLALFYTLDEVSNLVSDSARSFFGVDSYGVFIIVILLFYLVTYKLIFSPKDVLPKADPIYKQSKLTEKEVVSIRLEINSLMAEEKLFKKQKLNSEEVASHIGISKQQLSEVLNSHMKVRFQDLLNRYRVEEFINCLYQDDYKNYSILGLAKEVGFSSKSSFNATFKKIKGVTPSEYKKSNSA